MTLEILWDDSSKGPMTLPTRRWRAGEHIVVRDVWSAKVWEATPVVVISHDETALVEYQSAGTVAMAKTAPRGQRLDCLEAQSWEMAPSFSEEPGVNHYPAGGWSRIGLSWSPGFAVFNGWYVNLQRPLVPSRFGFDSMDLVLDIVVAPDCAWSWKDEAELAEARRRGLVTVDEERSIKAHAEEVLRMLDERRGPFAEQWVIWRPPEDWTLPALPADYDAP